MSASAPALGLDTPDPVSKLRDEIAQLHPPQNACERMLITRIAQSWHRLQRAYEVERRYFEGHDSVEIVSTKLDEFKLTTDNLRSGIY